ncbi:MAG: TIGR03084 family metal-binding protein [Sphingorhabdus sp.]
MQQAQDFEDENEALRILLSSLTDEEFEMPTLFKNWTINDIIRHLHVWNIAADLSLNDEEAFDAFIQVMKTGIKEGRLRTFEYDYLQGLSGQSLVTRWVQQFRAMAVGFAHADRRRRVKWVGPEMSVISSITARLMETWAHAQAIYDVLGTPRSDADRIGNIVRLGVNTYGWTFNNRRQEIPGAMPRLELTAPSGVIWVYGDDPGHAGDARSMIKGNAAEFCQVVTQCRNIADTSLELSGDVAHAWMAVAQCFAGPPQDPPPAGARYMKNRGAFK